MSALPPLALWMLFAGLSAVAPARGQVLHDIIEHGAEVAESTVEAAGKNDLFRLRSRLIPVPFTGLAVEIRTWASELRAAVRFEQNGNWGPLLPMHPVRSATSDLVIAGLSGDSARVDVRFEVVAEVPAGATLAFGRAGTFDGRDDEDARSAPPVDPESLGPLAGAEVGTITPPPLITRADWGATSFRGTPSPLANPSYEAMTFHHAAGYSASDRGDGVRQLRAIQDLHQNVRGWSDIGYHFVIDRAGNLYQGRPFLTPASGLEDLPVLALGAHVGAANTGNIGICLLGCYHPPEGSRCEEEITAEAYDTYVTLFAFLSERYGVEPRDIYGHRDFMQTACPGDNNYVLLPAIRMDVAELIVTGNESLGDAAIAARVDAGGVVNLSFTLLADGGIAGYRLERWVDDARTVLFEVSGALPSGWADGDLTGEERVEYRLFALGANGRRQLLDVIEVEVDEPGPYALAEAFPNPTSGDVRVRYWLRERGRVHLALYDGLGREVAVLADGFEEGGAWSIAAWQASAVAPGVYRYRLRVEGFSGIAFDRSQALVIVR